jgi:hypothetical protein
MGVSISHSSNQWGRQELSYSSLAEMGQQLAHVLPSSDWRKIKFLFAGHVDDIGLIGPERASQIGDVLAKAGCSRRMPDDWAATVMAIAAAAYRASESGEPWVWS